MGRLMMNFTYSWKRIVEIWRFKVAQATTGLTFNEFVERYYWFDLNRKGYIERKDGYNYDL